MTKLACVPLALTLLAATSCGSVQPGQALPDEAAVSHYISAKYSRIVDALSTNIIGKDGIRTREEANVAVDDKTSKFTNTSSAAGHPLQRVTVNEHNNDPGLTLLIFYPAHSKRTYMQLGRSYAKLSKTQWVSTPVAEASSIDDVPECIWEGLVKTCDAINTFSEAISNDNGSRVASVSAGRSTTLRADVTLNSIMQTHLIEFPPRLMSRISDKMRRGHISATLTLDGRGKLQRMSFLGAIKDGGHSVKFDIRFSYGPGDVTAIPKMPNPHDVTNLKKKSQVDHFNNEMAKMGN